MPLCNIRSIIEILIPGDYGSGLADYILWPIPFWNVPLLYILPFFFGGLWLMQRNFRLFLYIVIPLAFLNIWTQANSKYSYKPLPYTVPVDKADPSQADSVAPDDYTADGKYVWQDDDSRLSPASWGTSYVTHFHTKAIPGQVTQEEANYQLWLLVENADLILNNVYTADEYNSSMCYQLRDYLRAREKTEQDLAPLHYGGFSDRVKYRWAIDEMNAKPSPLQPIIDRRLNDDTNVQFNLWGPVVFGLVAFFAFGYLAKFTIKAKTAVETKKATTQWDGLLQDYNRARVIKTGLEIDGPSRLSYPKLFINDTPFDLDKAAIDEEHKNVINLKDGTRLYLYQGQAEPTYVHDEPVRKPRPSWNMEPIAGLTKQEPQPPTVATSARRRSIFNQG